MARAAGALTILVNSDSELMVKQMSGEYRVKAPHLKLLVERARVAMSGFTSVRLAAIPRERNHEADRLANLAMDEIEGRAGESRRED